jgi:phage terminase Nu1 subunit (DNA packaging protein)
MKDNLLNREQLAGRLQCSIRHTYRLQRQGMPIVLVGNSPRFDYDEILEWLSNTANQKGGEK